MTIKECLENEHSVMLERRYYGTDGFNINDDGSIGELSFDEVDQVEEEFLWCHTCGKGYSEKWENDGDKVLSESLENLGPEWMYRRE